MHGTPYTFLELATDVLPRHMESLRSSMAEPIAMREFDVHGDGPVTLARRHHFPHDVSGCYVLLEASRPIYVGISRKLFERVRQHVRAEHHLSATLAYRMALARQPFEGTAQLAMADAGFKAQFDAKRRYIAGLDVALVEISNTFELYVFEAYAALELRTGIEEGGWNTFRTH